MRKNKQLIVDGHNGDCFRASLTSLLGVPNDPKLPNISNNDWWYKWEKILRKMGMNISWEPESCWRSGFWIASVKSLNYENTTHAIVMKETNVWHDPSTKKRYKTGEYLGGNDVVRGGYILEIIDSSKLRKYEEFKKKYGND